MTELSIIDDSALWPVTREENRDVYQLFGDWTGKGAAIITSNRDTADWLAVCLLTHYSGRARSLESRTMPKIS